jgi:hypothetical protein
MTESIEPLLQRGSLKLREYLDSHFVSDTRPLGAEGLSSVTLDDFLAHTQLCLEYAVSVRTLHVLGRDGAIVAVLMASVRQRSALPPPPPKNR